MKRDLEHPVAVLGLPFNSLSLEKAIKAIERLVSSGGTHQVATANLDLWFNSIIDRHLQRIIAGCSLVFIDSMPLVWASRLLGNPLPGRVTGADVALGMAALSARKGYRIFLLGSRKGMAARTAAVLKQSQPGVRIVGTFAPSDENLTRMDHSEILRVIHAAQPDILLVDFGQAKQEKWIWMHRKRLGVPVTIGVGGGFEILVGDAGRTAEPARQLDLWSGGQEPGGTKRVQAPLGLNLRSLRSFAGLARRLPQALAAACLQRPGSGRHKVITVNTSCAMHAYVYGKLGADAGSALQKATTASILNETIMVVHLDSVRQVTAAGLGALLSARRQLLDAELNLSLAEVSFRRRFQLHSWCVDALFDVWKPAIARVETAAPGVEVEARETGRAENRATIRGKERGGERVRDRIGARINNRIRSQIKARIEAHIEARMKARRERPARPEQTRTRS